MNTMRKCFLLLIVAGLAACHQQKYTPLPNSGWIKGTKKERTGIIERQFRGFDNAMVETGYRYQELYWAGQDQNWEYAGYQLTKIKTAITTGLQRRPKRVASANVFLDNALPQMDSALQQKDTAIFNNGFRALTLSCNNCHAKEKVPFFVVSVPLDRQSPIRK